MSPREKKAGREGYWLASPAGLHQTRLLKTFGLQACLDPKGGNTGMNATATGCGSHTKHTFVGKLLWVLRKFSTNVGL